MNNTTKIPQKIPQKFICEKCDYKCSKKGYFNKHLCSKKHNTTNTTQLQHNFHICKWGKNIIMHQDYHDTKRTATYIKRRKKRKKHLQE